MRRLAALAAIVVSGACALIPDARAEVPPDIRDQLIKIGPIVDPPCTAKLYRPLMPANDVTSAATPLYPGIDIARDVSFGPHPKDVLDVFSAQEGAASRTVLIYVPGGAGNKIEIQNKESNAFYDNIGRWATKHGMVAITMQRHPGTEWDDGAKDVSRMIQWLQANVSRYHGNPDRMFIWAHSAGNIPTGNYIGHPELYGPKGVGVKGVIFMSAAAFNILPVAPPPSDPAAFQQMAQEVGKTCGFTHGMSATDGALPGRSPGQAGGPGSDATRPLGPPPADPATELARSDLPGLRKTTARILISNAELDMGVNPAVVGGLMPFNKLLFDELCKTGSNRCPTVLVAKDHSHVSIVFSIDTADTSVSGPVLAWINDTK
jgi:Carboxylesterase family